MALEEPYLEPSLTIQDLAAQMKMPVKDLSILIIVLSLKLRDLISHDLPIHLLIFLNLYIFQQAAPV